MSRKKKPVTVACQHKKGWKFTKTDKGCKRTCNSCGFSVTEVGAGIFGTTITPIKQYKRKKDNAEKITAVDILPSL